MISKEDVIKYILQAFVAIAFSVCGYFLVGVIDEVKALPKKTDVELMIIEKLEPVMEGQFENRERLIKVEQAIIGIISINEKLDGMDIKLDKACEDIAAIKAKQ